MVGLWNYSLNCCKQDALKNKESQQLCSCQNNCGNNNYFLFCSLLWKTNDCVVAAATNKSIFRIY